MLKVVSSEPASPQESLSVLDEIAREGARRMLAQAPIFYRRNYVERQRWKAYEIANVLDKLPNRLQADAK